MIAPASYTSPRSCHVYTPPALAEAMVQASTTTNHCMWLEPSVGGGVFVTALQKRGVKKSRIRAIDLSTEIQPSDAHASTVRGVDFLQWALASRETFDCVVGNPPYVPFDELSTPALAVASRITIGTPRVSLSGRANLWAAFVAAASQKIRIGGSMSLVLPAAWDYADYAASLRNWLPSLFREFTVFRCAKPLFDSVEEGCVVILGLGFGEPQTHSHRVETMSLTDLVAALSSPKKRRALRPGVRVGISKIGEKQFGDVAEITIGAVTGHTNFFVLTESQRKQLNLPVAAFRPVLSRARHLKSAKATAQHWNGLRDAGEGVWLFRPTDSVLTDSSVSKYLELSSEKGGCNRTAYKIGDRTPWHRTPLPAAPHAFLSGMTDSGPWLCLNRMPRLTATNTLYTVQFKSDCAAADQAAIAIALLTTQVRRQVDRLVRRYPGGLRKLEPSDLNQLLLPKLPNSITQETAEAVYSTVLQHLLEKREANARQSADEFFET